LKKLTLVIISLFLLHSASFGQANYYKLRLGAGGGAALAFADLDKKTLTFAGYGTIDYLVTPYVSLGAEVQKGELAGGDIIFDALNKQFINSYLSATLNLRVSFGEFITDNQRRNDFLNFLSGVYGGIGFGIIKNKVSNVRYFDVNYYPGDDSSTEQVIPFNLGVNINFPDRWGYDRYSINVNLQTTIDMGEGLDGYTPDKRKNDIYSYCAVGLRYQFGFMGLDKRR
jgi:hypothetical protein